VLAKQFDLFVSSSPWTTRIGELVGQVRRQPQAMIDLAEEQGPGVGRDARIQGNRI
jgi:hypothetical protein